MKTPFSDILQRLQVISDLANGESEALGKLASGGSGAIDLGSKQAWDAFYEPQPVNRALKAFLQALPNGVLTALTGLMYAGRDGEKDVLGYIADLRENIRTKDEMAEAISEKAPRMDYIHSGINYLPRQDVNTFYGQVLGKYGKKRKDGEDEETRFSK